MTQQAIAGMGVVDLLLVTHMAWDRRGRAAAVVVTSSTPGRGGRANRLFSPHVMGNFSLRSARVMVTVLFRVRSGLCHRRKSGERDRDRSSEESIGDHVCFSSLNNYGAGFIELTQIKGARGIAGSSMDKRAVPRGEVDRTILLSATTE